MASVLRDVVPILSILGIVLGFGALIGGFVVAVGRLDSWRIRRGFARVEAMLHGVRRRPEPLAVAYRIDALEGTRAGYRLHLTTGLGARLPDTGGASGPSTMRALVTSVCIDWTNEADARSVGPEPTVAERALWHERIRLDEAARTARFSVDPPRSRRDVEALFRGVRVAAERLDAITRAASPARAPSSRGPMPTRPERDRPASQLPPPPRFIALPAIPSEADAHLVIVACTSDFRCRGAVFVGPFPLARAREAWTLLEREYVYANAYLAVLARLDERTSDLEALRADAAAAMREITFYTVDRAASLERFFVLERTEDGSVALDDAHRLPAYPKADAARGAAAAAGARAHAFVALAGVDWHIHM